MLQQLKTIIIFQLLLRGCQSRKVGNISQLPKKIFIAINKKLSTYGRKKLCFAVSIMIIKNLNAIKFIFSSVFFTKSENYDARWCEAVGYSIQISDSLNTER